MNRRCLFLLLMVTATILTGCWGNNELNELALVAAFAIDKGEDGRYIGTIQVTNPANVTGGLQGGGGQGSPVTVYTSTGDSLSEMAQLAAKVIPRRIYYAHTNLVVIGEELAREEGLLKILDVFDRHAEFRTTTIVGIARGSKAADIVKAQTATERIPSNQVIKIIESAEKNFGQEMQINLQELITAVISPGKEPLLTGIRLVGDPKKSLKSEDIQQTEPSATLKTDGLAIFKDGKLIDWISGEKARGTIWILDKVENTPINIDWEEKKESISVRTNRQKTKVSATVKKGEPTISIDVRTEANINEDNVGVNLNDAHVLIKIEKLVEKEIKKELQNAVDYAQQNKSDILGFGEVVHRSDPKAWKKIKHDWNDVYFPKLKVDIKVKTYIRRTGLRNKSFLTEIENNQ